ncbi:hypothetical protein ACSBR2_041094 [Camellia fascicularis]
MDVFIPEEYATRRRVEKKAAAGAKKRRSEVVSDSRRRIEREETITTQNKPIFQLQNECFISSTSTGIAENIIYSCFSA